MRTLRREGEGKRKRRPKVWDDGGRVKWLKMKNLLHPHHLNLPPGEGGIPER